MKVTKKVNFDIFKNSAIKYILGGIAIFTFGIFVGYQLDNNPIAAIQGFLFNAVGDATDSNATSSNVSNLYATDTNATSSNATNSNVTRPNATNSNATNSNATNSNATNSNASSGSGQTADNSLYLEIFDLSTTTAKPGSRVNVNIGTRGLATKVGATILFKNSSNGVTFSSTVNSIGSNPYIDIPNNIAAGTYNVVEILLVGKNSNGSIFTRRWSAVDQNADYYVQYISKSLSISAKEINPDNNDYIKLALNSIALKSTEANVSDKVYVDFKASTEISSMKLIFSNENGNNMIVYVRSITNNPYFEIPTTTIAGDYSLVSATISSDESTILYSKDANVPGSEKFDFKSIIKVNNIKQQDVFVYNNEDLTNEIITDLYNAKNTATINVNADMNPIVRDELFNIIKGTNKKLVVSYHDNQLIFYGKDIVSSKTIDASISSNSIKSDIKISELVNDGIVLNFASNGNLPGNATIKIKITEQMKSKLGANKIYIYYYNEETKDFSEIASGVKPSSGYYEFKISHNSKYILVNEKLDDSLLSKSNDNIVAFQKSDIVNLLLIGLNVILVFVVLIIIIDVKRKNKKDIIADKINDNK